MLKFNFWKDECWVCTNPYIFEINPKFKTIKNDMDVKKEVLDKIETRYLNREVRKYNQLPKLKNELIEGRNINWK